MISSSIEDAMHRPKKLAIIILTYNRADAIAFYIKKIHRQLVSEDVDLIIYDSSSTNETARIVELYRQAGLLNIIYKRYRGVFDGVSLDNKVIEAYAEHAGLYRYLWLCRDGLIIEFASCKKAIFNAIEANMELIIVDNKERDLGRIGSRSYSDPSELLQDWGTNMITLGCIIVSSCWIKKVITSIPVSKANYTLWQMIAPFHYYANEPAHALSIVGRIYSYNVQKKSTAFWNSSGHALWQWAERYSQVLDLLPECYDSKKTILYKLVTSDFTPFSFSYLMRMKCSGSLSVRHIFKYRSSIKKVTTKSFFLLYVIAIFPIPHCMLRKLLYEKESLTARLFLPPFFYLREKICRLRSHY